MQYTSTAFFFILILILALHIATNELFRAREPQGNGYLSGMGKEVVTDYKFIELAHKKFHILKSQ